MEVEAEEEEVIPVMGCLEQSILVEAVVGAEDNMEQPVLVGQEL
jgi:hypothetical protein